MKKDFKIERKQWALRYSELGFCVIPCGVRKKKPVKSWTQFQARKPTIAEIEGWWKGKSEKNIAFVTGEISGIFVLDVDSQEGLDFIAEQYLPQTVSSKTSKGRHYYFKHPGTHVKTQTKLRRCIDCDIRGDGGIIVVPPSIHPSGTQYEWINAPGEVEIVEAPAWLLNLMQNPTEFEIAESIENSKPKERALMSPEYWVNKYADKAEPGNRNDSGFKLAIQLRDNGMSISEATPYMLGYAEQVPDASHPSHPYTKLEAITSLKNAFKQESRKSCHSSKNEQDMPFSVRMTNALQKVMDKLLIPTYRNILVFLAGHSDWDGENIFVSMRKLAQESGYSINTVQRSIHKLKRMDLLDIEVIYKDHEPGQFHHKYKLRLPMDSMYFMRLTVPQKNNKQQPPA